MCNVSVTHYEIEDVLISLGFTDGRLYTVTDVNVSANSFRGMFLPLLISKHRNAEGHKQSKTALVQ